MVLDRPVFDSVGNMLFSQGTELEQESFNKLGDHGVGELFIEDWRVDDVPIMSLINPAIEAEAGHALGRLLVECQATGEINETTLEEVERPIRAMTRELFPEVVGEINATGCLSYDEYSWVQPVKTAGLCLLMGRRLDYGMFALANLGMAAVLKDVGHLMLPMALADKPEDALSGSEATEFRKHPEFGARILEKHGNFDAEVVQTVRQHHEHWDGSGYPDGLKAGEISAFARILSIVDTFYDLVSARSNRPPYMPHEAIEYIMAYSGEWFDPEMVRVFARHVPLYPTGVMVKLNKGEIGIISDGNPGHVGRPIIRVCFDRDGEPVKKPYDVDLADPEFQDRMVVEVLEF